MSFRTSLLFLLIAGVLSACNVDTTERPEAGVDAGPPFYDEASGPITGRMGDDAGLGTGGPPSIDAALAGDAGGGDAACIALGCDELGYECGQALDNCGGPLNCNLANNASPCAPPLRCGGDLDLGTNKCGCKTRANACVAQGAQCGKIDECGNEIDCGSCPGGEPCQNNLCACTPNSNPCGSKVCGSAPDGCGRVVQCGANSGRCGVGTCGADGQCGCRPRAEACAGKTGSVMEDGCTYNCDDACIPDNVAACAGAECGTTTNNCGDVVRCGAAEGACGAGSTCLSGQFISDSALPARTAAYQGGYCVPSNVSKLLGKYAVRVHGFRQGGTTSVNIINRSEAVSLVTINYTRATQTARLTDVGCVATTLSAPDGLKVQAIIPAYDKFIPAVVDLVVSGDSWSRGDLPHPVLGAGDPNGYTVGIPDFCAGREGQEVDLPASDPRRNTFWSDNRCMCPTASTANALPVDVFSTAVSRDCRVVDSDRDGKPGFTAYAYPPLGVGATNVYSALLAHGIWAGVIRDDRYHVGWVGEAVYPSLRSVLGCGSASSPLCAPPGTDCGCEERQQPVQFVPLDDNAPLACDIYLVANSNPLKTVKQADIDAQFGKSFGSCSGAGQCPAGTLCRQNRCMPMTSKDACTAGAASGPCAGVPGVFCEACPAGMACKSDGACWPTATACPVSSVIGGLCAGGP